MNLDISRTSSFVIERTVILLLKNQTQQSKFPQKWHCPLRTNNVFSLQPRPSLLIGRTHFFSQKKSTMEQYTRKAAASYPVDWFPTKDRFPRENSVWHLFIRTSSLLKFHHAIRLLKQKDVYSRRLLFCCKRLISIPSACVCVYLRNFGARRDTFLRALVPTSLEGRILNEKRRLFTSASAATPHPFRTPENISFFFFIAEDWPLAAFVIKCIDVAIVTSHRGEIKSSSSRLSESLDHFNFCASWD